MRTMPLEEETVINSTVSGLDVRLQKAIEMEVVTVDVTEVRQSVQLIKKEGNKKIMINYYTIHI